MPRFNALPGRKSVIEMIFFTGNRRTFSSVLSVLSLSSFCFPRFNDSNQKVLRDYEIGYVKEGVGAGALSLLAQIKGLTQKEMVEKCDLEVANLFKSNNEITCHGI